ncbi:hypothetical protein OsccyDRAFT_1318 [Leptolyngbyaceae cyanobacterium JSC-12]|nr:hypothetical protein OsccyDRAFT_1318 [Leptolyngbyaceae cyanobacterium JSC-12]
MVRVPGSSVRSAIAMGQIMRRVIESGKITRADEVVFLQALSSEIDLTAEDMMTLKDLMKRMDMGLIKIAD